MGGSGKLARAYPRRPKAPPKSGHFQKKCIFGRDLAPQGAPKRPFGPAGSFRELPRDKNQQLFSASASFKSEIHAWGLKSMPGASNPRLGLESSKVQDIFP